MRAERAAIQEGPSKRNQKSAAAEKNRGYIHEDLAPAFCASHRSLAHCSWCYRPRRRNPGSCRSARRVDRCRHRHLCGHQHGDGDADDLRHRRDEPLLLRRNLTGSGAVTATVNSTATGRIAQADTGGTITLSLVNPAGSSAEIGAIAIATGAGNQTADANVTTALTQNASATTGDAVNTFTNDGSLLIDAVAVASASTGGADASAYNYAGAWQYATVALGGVGNASNSIVNNGTYTALASASAVAPSGFASADASQLYGIYQSASNNGTGNASNALDNEGSITIAANAFASGTSASASATNYYGIEQLAYATNGDATNTLTNGTAGVIDIHADATANGTTGTRAPTPMAYLYTGDRAIRDGEHGDATNTLNNDGTIHIDALANASNIGGAQRPRLQLLRHLAVRDALTPAATRRTRSTTKARSRSMPRPMRRVRRTRTLSGYNYSGITQDAYASGGGNATNSLTNGTAGSIDIGAVANASAVSGSATATASVYYAINQYATSTDFGNASNLVQNDGTINIHATANATASTAADANASVSYGVSQSAYADDGDASNTVNNSGTLNITAVANASGTSGQAYASAEYGIYQYATASDGDVTNTVDNGGTLNIDATAVANGTDLASATAYNYYGISQFASAAGNGDAANTVSNGTAGAIDIGAVATANATGSSGDASAYAYVSGAIFQSATATGAGNASNLIQNDGTINIHASANASGVLSATATATAYPNITQYATADDGDASTRSTTPAR